MHFIVSIRVFTASTADRLCSTAQPPSTWHYSLLISCLAAFATRFYKFSPSAPRRQSYFRCTRVWGVQPLSRVVCAMASDQEKNRQRVKQLLGKPGNGNCADCGAAGKLGGGESLTDAGHIFVIFSYFRLFVRAVYDQPTSFIFPWVSTSYI